MINTSPRPGGAVRGWRRVSLLCAALGVALAAAASSVPALATDPIKAGPDRVIDVSKVLDPAQEQKITEKLDALSRESNTDLYIAFVPEFTNPSDQEAWVRASGEGSGMRGDQYLIGVATTGRSFGMYQTKDAKLSGADRQKILDAMRPSLRTDDWAEAALAAADEAHDIIVEAPKRAANGVAIGAGVVGVGGAAAGVTLVVRRRRKKAAERASFEEHLATLEKNAGLALVKADDAVRSSTQEMSFAQAEFGDEVVEEFSKVLQEASAELTASFELRQKLDDEIPDTDQQKVDWNTEIIKRCERANELLDAKLADFTSLRKLAENAPAALERVRALRTDVDTAIAETDRTLSALLSEYASAALAPVADAPQQARSRIAFADEQIAAAAKHLQATETGPAAFAIRAAEGSLQQAVDLERSVKQLQTDFVAADQRARELIAELRNDVATAGTIEDPTGTLTATAANVKSELARLGAKLEGEHRSPLSVTRDLEALNDQIDAAIGDARAAEERKARAVLALDSAIARAESNVTATNAFISARRGAVGSEARTRITEANVALSNAIQLRESDPVQALDRAQRADKLARSAQQYAERDVSGWNNGGGSGGDNLGAFLGGLLIGSLNNSSAGRSSGGWGGFSGGGGGFGGGSFGGGSSGGGSTTGGGTF